MTSSHLFYYKTQRGTGLVLLHIDHGTGEFIDAVTVFQESSRKSKMDDAQKAAIAEAVNRSLEVALGPALSRALNKSSDIKELKRKAKKEPEFNKKGNKLRYKATRSKSHSKRSETRRWRKQRKN